MSPCRTFVLLFLLADVVSVPSAHAQNRSQPRGKRLAVYSVNLRKAVLSTGAGRKLQRTLQELRATQVADVRRAEEKLYADKPSLSEEQFRERYQMIQRMIEQAQRRLEQEQDKLLQPLLARLRKQVSASETDTVVFLEVSQEAPVGLGAACDRTQALVKAYRAGAQATITVAQAPEACTKGVLLYVEFDRVVKGLPESRSLVARLDDLQRRRQADIEKQTKALEALRKRAKTDRSVQEEIRQRARRLDNTFRAYQKELRDAERNTESELYGRVERLLTTFAEAPANRDILFVEHFGDRRVVGDEASLRRSTHRACEVTDWVIEARPLERGTLKKKCPWVGAKP